MPVTRTLAEEVVSEAEEELQSTAPPAACSDAEDLLLVDAAEAVRQRALARARCAAASVEAFSRHEVLLHCVFALPVDGPSLQVRLLVPHVKQASRQGAAADQVCSAQLALPCASDGFSVQLPPPLSGCRTCFLRSCSPLPRQVCLSAAWFIQNYSDNSAHFLENRERK
jgi:hypothetical protein